MTGKTHITRDDQTLPGQLEIAADKLATDTEGDGLYHAGLVVLAARHLRALALEVTELRALVDKTLREADHEPDLQVTRLGEAPPAGKRCRHEWTPPSPEGVVFCSKCGAAKGKQGRPPKSAATLDGATAAKIDPPTAPLPLPPPPAPPPAPPRLASLGDINAADRFSKGTVR